MTTKRNTVWVLPLLILGLVAGAWAAGHPSPVGERWLIESAPGDEPLLGPSKLLGAGLFTTHTEGAVVRLDNGRALRFEPNSAGLFEPVGPDDVRLTVLSGRVLLSGEGDRVSTAGAGSVLLLDPGADDVERVARLRRPERER
jgi:hypothetical protein